MTWFSASIFYRAVHSEPRSEPDLWEERIVLLEAIDLEDAMSKARTLGPEGETSYAVTDVDAVAWSFDRVASVVEIDGDTLRHGTELFSRFLRESEAISLITPFEE